MLIACWTIFTLILFLSLFKTGEDVRSEFEVNRVDEIDFIVSKILHRRSGLRARFVLNDCDGVKWTNAEALQLTVPLEDLFKLSLLRRVRYVLHENNRLRSLTLLALQGHEPVQIDSIFFEPLLRLIDDDGLGLCLPHGNVGVESIQELTLLQSQLLRH